MPLKKYLLPLTVLILLIMLSLSPTFAQSPDLPPMAAATAEGLRVFGLGNNTLLASGVGDRFGDIQWTPDGNFVVYSYAEEDFSRNLYFVAVDAAEPVLLAQNLAPGFPFRVADNNTVYYALRSEREPQEMDGFVDIFAAPLLTRDAPRLVGTVPFGSGCGGGSSFPGDATFSSEAGGFQGRDGILAVTPSGIIYHRNCTTVGTVITDPATGAERPLGNDLTEAALSPDGLRVAGTLPFEYTPETDVLVQTNTLVLVSVDFGAVTTLEVNAPIQEIVWANNEVLYYASRSLVDQVPYPEGIPQDLFGSPELGLRRIYQVEVYRVNVSTGEETQVFSIAEDAYIIGRLQVTANPDVLLLSVVPNGDAWYAAIAGGEPIGAEVFGIDGLFAPRIYQVDAATGESALLTTGLGVVAPYPVMP